MPSTSVTLSEPLIVMTGAVSSRGSRLNHTTSPSADASVIGEPIRIDGISRLFGLATVRSSSARGFTLASMSVSTMGMRSPEFHVPSATSSERSAKKCPTTPDFASGEL